jgi:hypothetical protein
MSAGITRDPQKAKDEADIRRHIEAFFAKGGKAYKALDGESGCNAKLQPVFTITPAKKKGAA